MHRLPSASMVLLLLLVLTGAAVAPLAAQDRPRNVILFIGDGVGASAWTAAKFASDALAVRELRVMGLVDTRSSDSYITDSGAGATAYAAGVRTFNGAIGVGPDSNAVTTVLEIARDQGWATGLVATSSVTHATPASFAAHVPSRASEFDIARDLVANRVDVLLGGGTRYFDGRTRPDSVDLLARLRGTHAFVTLPQQLAGLDLGRTRRLVGLFAGTQMPSARDRTPTLPEMTRAAIEVLSNDPDGFFLMVEGSQPDWRAHANEPLEAVTAEMLDFDRAIGVAVEYRRRNPGTLIVVVADHETGGLAIGLGRDSSRAAAARESIRATMMQLAATRSLLAPDQQPMMDSTLRALAGTANRLAAVGRGGAISLVADYTSTGHSAQMVPLFAGGPGAERFAGIIENFEVGERLIALVRR